MNTSAPHKIIAVIAAALSAAVAIDPPQAPAGTSAQPAVHVVSVHISTAVRPFTYGWPIKPFDRQHPVRAFLNDPRIGDHGGKAFHFGIDIAAPDGTPVYAVEAGTVYFDSPVAIAVVAPDRSHSFGYWHIVPAVKSHQFVRRHQLLGRIGKGWEHVHFAERRGGLYFNPLRPGGIGPYVDRTAPTVNDVRLADGGIVADVADSQSPRVFGDWANEPLTPALLRWRVVDADGAGAWRIAADFRKVMLPASEFSRVYAPETEQNHKGIAGRFSIYLAHGQAALRSAVAVEVEASDTYGNRVVVSWSAGV